MRSMFVVAIAAFAAVGFAACGGNAKTSPTPTPAAKTAAAATAPAASKTPSPAPAASVVPASSAGAATVGIAGADKLTVTGGAPGGTASATIHTTSRASCSIVYTHPSGKVSTAQGLTPKTAGADGAASWTWKIDPTTKVGNGTVAVTCGTAKTSAPITIGAAPN